MVYALFLIAYPDWNGMVYHVVSLSVIGAIAVGFFILLKAIDITSMVAKIALELAFAVVVALYLAYSLPLNSGKTPWELWAHGHRPTQSAARDGFSRLGVNPNSQAAGLIISLFPTH